MAFFLLLLFVIPSSLSFSASAVPKSRTKVVEEYIISAKFDENNDFPQLRERSRMRNVYLRDGTNGRVEEKDVSLLSRGSHGTRDHAMEDFEDRDVLEERDLLVHHHHLPPHPPPPVHPPPPPPLTLAYAPAFFAIGLITFLLLLNSLQMRPSSGATSPTSSTLNRKLNT